MHCTIFVKIITLHGSPGVSHILAIPTLLGHFDWHIMVLPFSVLLFSKFVNREVYVLHFQFCGIENQFFLYFQNSVKLNLNQSKFFCKVEKKKDAVNKVAYWQIDSLYAAQLQEVSLHSCGKDQYVLWWVRNRTADFNPFESICWWLRSVK